jgi:hypothetical protein
MAKIKVTPILGPGSANKELEHCPRSFISNSLQSRCPALLRIPTF